MIVHQQNRGGQQTERKAGLDRRPLKFAGA
jgi:hypothetical protein